MISEFCSRVDTVYNDSLVRFYINLFGHEIFKRFAVVGHARTGSNYLFAGLKSSKSRRKNMEPDEIPVYITW